MNLAESFRVALRAINANKVRALLTMLGVIIGVASVILLVSIGSGVQKEITGSIESLGSNQMYVFPRNMRDTMTAGGGGMSFGGGGSPQKFSLDDVDMLQQAVPDAKAVIPENESSMVGKANGKSGTFQTVASNQDFTKTVDVTVDEGRFYSRGDVTAASRNVVIGQTVKKNFFGNLDPVGQSISINNQRCTIIGVMEKRGGGMTGDMDNVVYMPITLYQRITGNDDISMIIVAANDAQDIPDLQKQVERALTPKFGNDFSVMTQDQTLSLVNTMMGTLTAMLGGIAGISLLVGGIGIMNIMLVSVTERTREIGIRKAVGARTYDILSQFVIEALMLSIIGGIIGIIVGAVVGVAIQSVVPTSITLWSVALAFFFSVGVGLFFGVYPAWKASKLDPIVALRYE